jgi:hypothetical protein
LRGEEEAYKKIIYFLEVKEREANSIKQYPTRHWPMPMPMMATSTAAGSPPSRSKTRALITRLKATRTLTSAWRLVNQIIRIRPGKNNNQTQRLGQANMRPLTPRRENNQRSLFSTRLD